MATANLPVPIGNNNNLPIAAGETSSSAIAAREKASVEARFIMAMNRPRDFETSRRRLMDACRRPGFAEVARYSKPVGRERITGLSIRFAEEARVLWGNMDVTVLLVFDDEMVEKFVERRQTRDGMEIIGSRTNTSGQTVYKIRATEDDLAVKAGAQISKQRRNCILALLPADVKEECENQCIATLAKADAEDPGAARKKLLDAFWNFGVTPAQIVELLGHPVEQMNPSELTLFRSYYTALKDGEATWAAIVEAHTGKAAKPAEAAQPTKGTDGLKAAIDKKKPAQAPLAPDTSPIDDTDAL
jgi:hypothetical protein